MIGLQHFFGRLDVQPSELHFQCIQIFRRDPIIGGSKKQQRHGRRPGQVEGFRQNQQRLLVRREQCPLHDIDRQGAQQRQRDDGFIKLTCLGVLEKLGFSQLTASVLRTYCFLGGKVIF